MAKVTGPLLGFNSRGQIGKTQVYARWRGVQYARQHVIPANPQTAAQTQVRNLMRFLSNWWKAAPPLSQNPWSAFVVGKPLTPRNALMSKNIPLLNGKSSIDTMVLSPGVGGGIPATAVTFTAGTGQITVAGTAPSLPTGWTISAFVASATPDVSPQVATIEETVADEATASPYSVVLTGLTAAQSYHCGGWFVYTKPDTTTAYGPSTVGSATPS